MAPLDVVQPGEARALKDLAGAVGEERHLGTSGNVDQPASSMALRFFALQRADALPVDAARAEQVLESARGSTAGAVEPVVPVLHRSAPLEGEVASGALIDPLTTSRALESGLGSGTAEATLAADSGSASARVEREGTSELGERRSSAGGNVAATGSGVRVDASGETELKTTTESGAELQAGGRGGVTVDESGAISVDVGVDASARRVRERTLADGARQTVTTVSAAKGDVLDGTFSGERSRATRTERQRADRTNVVDERVTGVRGDSTNKTVEGFASQTRTETRGDDVRARRLEGSVGLKGARGKLTVEERDTATGEGRRRSAEVAYRDARVSTRGEWMATSREATPDGDARDVERGYAGKAELHRLGFSADVLRKTSDGEGGAIHRGASVVYDPTGVSVAATRERADAGGDVRGASDGVKLRDGSAGATLSRSKRERLSDTEALDTGRTFDLMLGNRQASAALTRASTKARLGGGRTLEQHSTFQQLAGNIEAFRVVSDKGPVTSQHPALAGKHAVEVHQKVDGGGGAFLGDLVDAVGLYGGLRLQRGKEILYKTHLEPSAAAAAARKDEDKGALSLARKHLPGTSLVGSEKVALPDLSRPESLKLYDEVQLSTTGSVSVEVGAQGYTARAGIAVHLQGDFALHVKKVADQRVEVDVSPTRIRGVKGTAGAVLVEGSVGAAGAASFRQRFSFDLSTEGGRAAYQAAVRGEMPGGLSGSDVDATKDGLALVQQGDLPNGVTRLLVEKVEVRQIDVAGSVGWMFLKAGRTRSRRTTEHMVSDGDVSVNLHARGLERRRKTLLSGNEARAVTGALRAVTTLDEQGRKVSTFDALVLEARLSDDKVKGSEINDEMVAVLNEAFGLSLKDTSQRGKKEQRDVTVSVELLPASLARLGKADEATLSRVAAERGGSASALRQLTSGVRSATDEHGAARAVQSFVAEHGVVGMGQVVALAGESASLELSTSTSAYAKPLADARVQGSRFEGVPWDVSSSKKDLSARYKAVKDTESALEDGLRRLEEDPFYVGREQDRSQLLAEMKAALAQLEPLCDFSRMAPEDALAIYQKLDGGWTTSVQARFQKELAAEAGLTSLQAGLRSAKASAERRDGAITERTRTTSSRKLLRLFGDERTQVTSRTTLVRREDGRTVLDGMALRAEIRDDKSRRGEAGSTSRWLARAFGGGLGDIGGTDPWQGVERTITVERSVTKKDLARLRSASERSLVARAEGSADPARASRLIRALVKAGDDVAAAKLIERHLERHGADGMGDVHRLLGDGALQVRSHTGAYDEALAVAAEVASAHAAPLEPGATNRAVAGRFESVAEARSQLDAAERLLLADGLASPEESDDVRCKLKAARASLDDVVVMEHLPHEGAAELVARLESGWVSKHEAAAARAIREAVGLVDVKLSGGVLLARSLRESSGARIDMVSRRERSLLPLDDNSVTLFARRVQGSGELTTELRFFDASERDGELSRDVVARLNQAFGTTFSARGSEGDGSARTITVRSTVDGAALLRVPRERTLREAEAAGLSRRDAAALLNELARLPDDETRVTSLQDFLAEHGMAALGWIHRSTHPGAAPDITSESEGVASALARAEEALLLQGRRAMRPEMTVGQLLAAERSLSGARAVVVRAHESVASNPLLPREEKQRLLRQLESTERALVDAGSFAHLSSSERQALRARIGTFDALRHAPLIDRLERGA